MPKILFKEIAFSKQKLHKQIKKVSRRSETDAIIKNRENCHKITINFCTYANLNVVCTRICMH